MDDYAKDDGPGEVWQLCSFTMILCNANFFVWWDMKLKFASHLFLVSAIDLTLVQFQITKLLTFSAAEARNGSW